MALKIEPGQRFGKLTTLRHLENDLKGYRQWLCKCECGNEKAIKVRDLTRHKSCGCLRYMCRIIQPGDKHGRLTALRYTRRGGCAKAPYFLFRCECGKEKELNVYRVVNGLTKSCGCLRHQNIAAIGRSRRLPNSEGAVRVLYMRCQCRASDRGFKFNLLYEDFKRLAVKPCHYCGQIRAQTPNKHHKNVLFSGLDRVDSNLGYLLQNVVPCCRVCNTAKSAMTPAQFKFWLAETAQYMLLTETYKNGTGI
jgi:hypothetical protein